MNILNWWASWWMIGIISLPITTRLFARLSDKGYGVARLFGLLIVSYGIWLMASLKILPFNSTGVWVGLAVWTLVNWYIYRRNKKLFTEVVRDNGWKWLRIEAIFIVLLLMWSWVRSFSPDINGLEKFMDYGFMNSILRSEYFPPNDMWYAGHSINYYYYGHYVSALMTRISHVDPAVSYNLMIATILANGAIAIYSLVGSVIEWSNLKNKRMSSFWGRLGGTLAVFLLLFRGNLHLGAYELGQLLSKCEIDQNSIKTCQPRVSWINMNWFPDISKGYWYPDATRYIPYTIHEFPIYSFVVADLHAHLINLPFVIVYLSFLLCLIKQPPIDLKKWFLAGGMLGIFYMTNAWDWPIYMLLTGLILLYLQVNNIRKLSSKDWSWSALAMIVGISGVVAIAGLGAKISLWRVGNFSVEWPFVIVMSGLCAIGLNVIRRTTKPDWPKLKPILYELIFPCVIIFGVSILVALPFHLKFEQIAQGVDMVKSKSEFSKLLTLWGWDWAVGLILIGIVIRKKIRKIEKENDWDEIMLIVWGLGVFLIIIPEFIYIKDIYIQEYHRANTMFKLVYQSWTLFSIVSAYTVIRLLRLKIGSLKRWFLTPIYILGALMLWQMGRYPFVAIQSYYSIVNRVNGEINWDSTRKGLNGEVWLREMNSDEYAVLEFLKTIKGAPVILEATGDSYTEFNRFSAYTGLPAVEGWLVHEWLWRGSYDGPGRRASEVEHMYTAKTLAETKAVYNQNPIANVKELINKYQVKYIIVGEKEREKYATEENPLNEGLIKQIGKEIFESGNSRVYQIGN